MASFLDPEMVRRQLNLTGVVMDADLELAMATACDMVEQVCGPVSPQTVTEYVRAPYGVAVLSHRPSSLTAVPSGVVGDYRLDSEAGLVYGSGSGSWSGSVTYEAGFPAGSPPAWAVQAGLILTDHFWKARRGSGGGARNATPDAQPPGASAPLPRQAVTIMDLHRLAPRP